MAKHSNVHAKGQNRDVYFLSYFRLPPCIGVPHCPTSGELASGHPRGEGCLGFPPGAVPSASQPRISGR